MILTAENYYDREADLAYMSCSQYQGFLRCEAMQVAKLQGRYVEESGGALVVGNYVHTYMEGQEPHQKFCEEHFADIYKTKVDKKTGAEIITGKYSTYVQADEMIDCINKDETFSKFRALEGEVEKIMCGEICGVPWRIRMDKYISNPRIILDWKTAANIRDLEYNPITRQRETFLEFRSYLMRAAVYSEVEKQNTGQPDDAMFLIGAVTKQSPPDKGLFSLNHRDRYAWEISKIKENISHIMRVKEGAELPRRCGTCEYCRMTAAPVKIKPYYVLRPENWEGYEYDCIAGSVMVNAKISE